MPPKLPDFGPTQRLQKEYEKYIKQIVARATPPKEPEQTFEQWLAAIAARSQEQDIQEASDFLARKMVHWVNVRNAQTWRQAAARSQHSRKLYNLLQKEMQGVTGARVSALVRENAALISSLPLQCALKLNDEILRAQQAGARPGTISKMMKARFPALLKSRTNLISRTETAKASTALTKARCEDLGIDFYIWESSKDVRTRDSHLNMHGVLVPWHQAPSPELLIGEPSQGNYHAGEIYNCRCTELAVLELDDISWPRRVYWNGAITMMTKPEFLRQVAPRAA